MHSQKDIRQFGVIVQKGEPLLNTEVVDYYLSDLPYPFSFCVHP